MKDSDQKTAFFVKQNKKKEKKTWHNDYFKIFFSSDIIRCQC
jgi:hypothetical protein